MNNRLFDYRAVLVFVLAFAVFALRRPDILTNAQFWAEDGRIWFPTAYHGGFWDAIFVPENGYFQVISRLTFAIAIHLPLEDAPVFTNSLGLAIRALPLAFLFTSRFDWVDERVKILIALYVVLMPGLTEVHANITNAHWYLAMYMFLVVIANDPDTKAWKVHDLAVIVLAGLSGPFVVFVAACLIFKFWEQIQTEGVKFFDAVLLNLTIRNLTLGSVCVVQLVTILSTSADTRSSAPLGASIDVFLSVINSRVLAGFMFFPNKGAEFLTSITTLSVVFVISMVLCGYLFVKGDWRQRSVIAFPIILLGFVLARPMVDLVKPQWPLLMEEGGRYFVIPNIFWATVIILAVLGALKLTLHKNLAALALAGSFIWVSVDYFRIDPLADMKFKEYARKYEASPIGSWHRIPVNPPGWFFDIVKGGKEMPLSQKMRAHYFRSLARHAGYLGEFGDGKFNSAQVFDPDLRSRYQALQTDWINPTNHNILLNAFRGP